MATEALPNNDMRLTGNSAMKGSIQTQKNEGVQDTEIVQRTGHKNVNSLLSYYKTSLEQQKKTSPVTTRSQICDEVCKHLNFETLSELDQEIIQSDIGVFWGSATSKNYTICPAHVKLFKDKHESRLRRYACNVPTYFASEHDHEKQKNKSKFGRVIRGDRRVSSDQMRTIYTEHGVVIPIETYWKIGINMAGKRKPESAFQNRENPIS
ncbi:unnamed protein product [Mytilus coruscus]|uniref:Uncharacterized protein n=1 Tax=Mytilus coruscus TaxID=42192 RepID=A0A6J8C339_MYTCO|nr:unnamed protein product [Mytilus coruscus]